MKNLLGVFQLIVLSGVISSIHGACDPPLLPERFTATINYNIKGGDFKGMTPNGEMGFTVTAIESYSGPEEVARIDFFTEMNNNDNTAPAITQNTILWNPTIQGVKNYVTASNTNGGAYTCIADDPNPNRLQMLLWGFDGKEPKLPSIQNILHFVDGSDINCEENVYINGILCDSYNKDVNFESMDGSLVLNGNMTYYMSKPGAWDGTAGPNKTVPVYAVLDGMISHDVPISFNIAFTDFYELALPDYDFFLPPDLSCENRSDGTQKLPYFMDFFQFDSEQIMTWTKPGTDQEMKVINPMTETYDYSAKISRSVYKPMRAFDFDNPFNVPGGEVTEIRDFYTGIAYTIFNDYGNCSVHYLDITDMSGDAYIGPHGEIIMNNPLQMFHTNQTYNFNGVDIYRDMLIRSYISSNPKGAQGKGYTSVMYYTAGDTYVEGNSDVMLKMVPVYYSGYITPNYNIPSSRIIKNIFGFKGAKPDMNLFDITYCFKGNNMIHKMIRMGWNSDMNTHANERQVEDALRQALSQAGGCTPIRIQRIAVYPQPDESAMYVVFTVVGFPVLKDDHLNLPPQSTVNLTIIANDLRDAIQDGFVVTFKDSLGVQHSSQADKDYFIDVDRNDGHGHNPPKPNNNNNKKDDSGYSPGSMAVLGIFMILIGVGGGVALLYFVLKW